MKIISAVGARPNFMKIAPFIRAIERHSAGTGDGPVVGHLLVHTGQHYDHQMSQKFFDDLNIPPANIHLGVGSVTHRDQKINQQWTRMKKLKKRFAQIIPGVFSSILLLGCVPKEQEEVSPNTLFIFSDDHATHAIGAYGPKHNNPGLHQYVITPNLDQLAELFTNRRI